MVAFHMNPCCIRERTGRPWFSFAAPHPTGVCSACRPLNLLTSCSDSANGRASRLLNSLHYAVDGEYSFSDLLRVFTSTSMALSLT